MDQFLKDSKLKLKEKILSEIKINTDNISNISFEKFEDNYGFSILYLFCLPRNHINHIETIISWNEDNKYIYKLTSTDTIIRFPLNCENHMFIYVDEYGQRNKNLENYCKSDHIQYIKFSNVKLRNINE